MSEYDNITISECFAESRPIAKDDTILFTTCLNL